MTDPSPPLVAPPEFLAACEAYGIAFDDGDLERFGRFLSMLIDVNRQMNLTRITEPGEAWMRHVFDSLTLLPLVGGVNAERVVDIGSGGGSPAIPLAIALSDVAFTLVEATGKKARFLEDLVETLSLPNATIINERAEDIGRDRDNHREYYDVVTARAVGPLAVVLELAVPLARVGGLVLAIKGAAAADEVADAAGALEILHGEVINLHPTPTGTVVVVEKQLRTGKLYPRRPGEPKRVPLGRTGRPA